MADSPHSVTRTRIKKFVSGVKGRGWGLQLHLLLFILLLPLLWHLTFQYPVLVFDLQFVPTSALTNALMIFVLLEFMVAFLRYRYQKWLKNRKLQTLRSANETARSNIRTETTKEKNEIAETGHDRAIQLAGQAWNLKVSTKTKGKKIVDIDGVALIMVVVIFVNAQFFNLATFDLRSTEVWPVVVVIVLRQVGRLLIGRRYIKFSESLNLSEFDLESISKEYLMAYRESKQWIHSMIEENFKNRA